MLVQKMIVEKFTLNGQNSLIENIGDILYSLVGVKDWILWIDKNSVSVESIYTSSLNSENILGYFQELIKKNCLLLAEGNYLSLIIKKEQGNLDYFESQEIAILILPITQEGKLLGAIGLLNSAISWEKREISILQSLVYQWVALIKLVEEKENRPLCDVVKEVNSIINRVVSFKEMLNAILDLTQDRLKLKELILLRMVGEKELVYKKVQAKPLFKNAQRSCHPFSGEKNGLIIPLFLGQKKLGRLVLKLDSHREKLSKEETEIIAYIQSQLIIILEKLEDQTTTQQKEKNLHLSHVHHELRTPLVAILGFSRMLNEEIYGGLNPKQKQYIQGIVTSGEHLLDLVNNFLDIFKIDAYQEELFWETAEVKAICQSVLCMVEPIIAEKGLELKLEIDSDISVLGADQRRLKQILVNLLSNAIKFTVKGSITLQVKHEGNNLLFSVIDTGIGINPSEQHKLFETFGQIKNPLSNKYKGTGVGLGLALSRKLARLHGGEITLVSQEGQGSCFTLHLPLK